MTTPAPFALAPLAGSLLVAAGAGVLTWLLLAVLIPILRQSLLDQPNARSSHRVPTPRGGGVAFVLVGSATSALFGQGVAAWLPMICLPLALVGLWDDRVDLPAGVRYAAQFATAVALVAVAQLPLPALLLPLVVVAVTAVINFLNFMDGLDGLVGLACVVVMAAAGVWPVAGALLGFLVWNWSPAKVFMGDVGSTWLGALLAGLVLQQSTAWGGISLLLVAFPLLADPLICLMRRLRAGQPIFQAHRLHLFQRLQGAGWSHAQVALLYGVGTLVMALGRLHSNHAPLMLLLALEFGAGLKLDRSFAVPFFQDAANKL